MLTYATVPPRTPPPPTRRHHCLVLHGLGDSKHGWMQAAPLFALDQLGWSFADAPHPYGPGYSWFELGLPGFEPDLDQIKDSNRRLDALIDHLLAELALPAERLFLMGFSQGCVMACVNALRSRHRFAGVIGLSGFQVLLDEYPAAFGPHAREQRLLLTHGRFDDVIPFDLVEPQVDDLRRLGLQVEWRAYDTIHTLDLEREVPDVRAWMQQRMR